MLGKIGSRFSAIEESIACTVNPCRNALLRRIMERFLEQRYAIKFCVKLAKTGKGTRYMIKEAYDDAAMSRSGIFEWQKLFREGRKRLEGKDHYGRPSTSKTNQNVSRVRNLLNSDRRMSIRIIADELSIPQTQVFEIVTGILAISVPSSGVSCPAQCGNTASSLPYSPDLAKTDYFLFPRIKSTLKGKHHGSIKMVQ
ncbi:protein GVQW3 [Trichonephila clavipes]|nr:protein GVQW3 [Trichonephila clavipes]